MLRRRRGLAGRLLARGLTLRARGPPLVVPGAGLPVGGLVLEGHLGDGDVTGHTGGAQLGAQLPVVVAARRGLRGRGIRGRGRRRDGTIGDVLRARRGRGRKGGPSAGKRGEDADAEITGESVQLYRREGDHRVCVAAAEPPSGLRDTVPVGSRLPMTAGSGAKVLAAWADPRADSFFSDRALADVRKRGWAQSAGERAAGVASVSAPLRDANGDVVAAISVSGPIDRMGRRPGARWAADLLAAAGTIVRARDAAALAKLPG